MRHAVHRQDRVRDRRNVRRRKEETAKAFAERGGSVVLTGRDAQRGKDVVAEIQAASGTARADLAAQAPVRHR